MVSLSGPLACFAILAVLVLFLANKELNATLSPQGCRMSFMSPSYVLQNGFNMSWTPLAQRYSLWLYREVGWDTQTPNGLPVLFIPGNAGSSHQVRSIASSASRQYYSSPGQVSPDLWSRGIGALDIYAVDFNEDLSALHGTTLQSQIEYTSKAIDYILSQYPPHTSLIILGHSMGGVVATALLPSERISTIITMSTPHTLPPARFDSRIDDIYAKIRHNINSDATLILSLCGGATDGMVPSESCILPRGNGDLYRETIFTSAMEGAWTGVGHREMVWCHQVRWRIARALLELCPKKSPAARKEVLDIWLRDGHKLPPGVQEHPENSSSFELSDQDTYDIVPPGLQLIRKPVDSRVYLLPVPPIVDGTTLAKLSVLVGKGSIPPVYPQTRHALQISVYICSPTEEGSDFPRCSSLKPITLKLLPKPIPGELFPRPRIDSDPSSGGVDESDGVVLYEAEIALSRSKWVGIKADNGEGEGWVAAGFNYKEAITDVVPITSLLFRNALVEIKGESSMRLDVRLPRLLSNALIVYRLIPRFHKVDHCTESYLAPLLIHISHPIETHYYPLIIAGDRRISLHTHYPAPYHGEQGQRGLHLIIYSSGSSSCIDNLEGLDLSIDWPATLGRWASRYLTTLVGWATGVSSILLFLGLGMYDRGAPMPSIGQSLRYYGRILSCFMLPISLFASFLPWPTEFYLGLGSSGVFAPLAPLILLIASGLVVTSWWVLRIFLYLLRPPLKFFMTRKHEGSAVGRSTIISMCIIFVMIFLFVPWQVAYLGCWIYQLLTCATAEPSTTSPNRTGVEGHPLVDRSAHGRSIDTETSRDRVDEQARDHAHNHQDNYRLSCHILLFMTWLLPLAAPVLAVWVRTLITAGFTIPFDGDHFFLNVAPFLVLVDFSSWTSGPIFMRQRFEDQISARWAFAFVAVVSFLVGGYQPYKVFDAGKIAVGLLVGVRVGRRYWGGVSWSVAEPRRQGV